jgi:hypothetical protein
VTQSWFIASPGPIEWPVQTVDGRRIRVTRRDGSASGEHVLVCVADNSEWVAVGARGNVARLVDVEGFRRTGETLAEAARRHPTGAA